jgi:hypothetical protein
MISEVSAPSWTRLPPGIYYFWAERNGIAGPKKLVEVNGASEISVDVVVP